MAPFVVLFIDQVAVRFIPVLDVVKDEGRSIGVREARLIMHV